jgi:hypothetical protein
MKNTNPFRSPKVSRLGFNNYINTKQMFDLKANNMTTGSHVTESVAIINTNENISSNISSKKRKGKKLIKVRRKSKNSVNSHQSKIMIESHNDLEAQASSDYGNYPTAMARRKSSIICSTHENLRKFLNDVLMLCCYSLNTC